MTVFEDGLERSPFEDDVAELLAASVQGVVAPPGLAASIRSRVEAPDAVGLLAAVDVLDAPASPPR